MRIALTDLAIRKLKVETGQLKVWDTKTPGFGIIVGVHTKTFTVVYGKKRLSKSLGRWPEISLAEARKAAMRVMSQEHEKNRSISLTATVNAYLEDCRTRLRPNTVKEYSRHLSKAPDVDLSLLSRNVVDLTEPQAVTAWKAFANWCLRHELVKRNPFQFERASYIPRTRVLTNNELQAIWHYEHKPYSDIIKLLILTGQRKSEIAKMQSEWINGDLVTIPASFSKNRHEHTFPIGPYAVKLISDISLPHKFNGWSKSKHRLDKATGVSDWTHHDLRRTYATIHASIGTPVVVTEKLLNHISGTMSGIVGVYQRHHFLDEMRHAVLKYEGHLTTIISARATT